jgi:hypothetical protein
MFAGECTAPQALPRKHDKPSRSSVPALLPEASNPNVLLVTPAQSFRCNLAASGHDTSCSDIAAFLYLAIPIQSNCSNTAGAPAAFLIIVKGDEAVGALLLHDHLIDAAPHIRFDPSCMTHLHGCNGCGPRKTGREPRPARFSDTAAS